MSVYIETQEIIIDSINTTNKTISIAKDTIVKKDSQPIAKSRDRRAFVPGDIAAVKDYLGTDSSPEIDYLNAIWTEQAINDYLASLSVPELNLP